MALPPLGFGGFSLFSDSYWDSMGGTEWGILAK